MPSPQFCSLFMSSTTRWDCCDQKFLIAFHNFDMPTCSHFPCIPIICIFDVCAYIVWVLKKWEKGWEFKSFCVPSPVHFLGQRWTFIWTVVPIANSIPLNALFINSPTQFLVLTQSMRLCRTPRVHGKFGSNVLPDFSCILLWMPKRYIYHVCSCIFPSNSQHDHRSVSNS